MFSGDHDYIWYITLALQGICVVHLFKNRRNMQYLWLILLLPIVGSLAYLYLEVLPSTRIRSPKVDLTAVFNPGAKIKKLEEALKFSDTFNNRMNLADAYLEGGFNEQAIVLYEESLTGAFAENEHARSQLVSAYYASEDYAKAVAMAETISRSSTFNRSPQHLLYAKALEQSGQSARAEEEFKKLKGRFSCFEFRYEYGLFLRRANRDDEAIDVFEEMLDEAPHISGLERKVSKEWIDRAKSALKEA